MQQQHITPERSPFQGLLSALSMITLAGFLALGCKKSGEVEEPVSHPDHAEGSEEITANATVTAVDPLTRMVSLKNEQGEMFNVMAGPAVANFDQIEVGDDLKVRYKVSMAVSLMAPGSMATPASGDLSASAAAIGGKPGAKIEGHVQATLRVESVDTDRNIVVVTPPGGGLQAIHVVRKEGQEFIKGLKPGDRVEITYSEALALSIDKQ